MFSTKKVALLYSNSIFGSVVGWIFGMAIGDWPVAAPHEEVGNSCAQ